MADELASAVFRIDDIVAAMAAATPAYKEFLRVDRLNCGIYRLEPGDADAQQPHVEDEIYYVIAGKATLRTGDGDEPLVPGSVVYVRREKEHRFVDIEERLVLLVVFAANV